MRFEENYIIQLPQAIIDDKELNWTDRVAFHLYSKYRGNSKIIMDNLGISFSRLRAIRSRLIERGFLMRVVDQNNNIVYQPIDINTKTWNKIKELRAASKTGLNRIGDQNILAWQNQNHSLPFILQTLEILEFTYRNSKNEKIKNASKLVHTVLKRNGTNPPEGFTPGFWEEKKAATKKSDEQHETLTDLEQWKESKRKFSELTKKLNQTRGA